MGARDVAAPRCGVRKTAGRDAPCRSRAVVEALGPRPNGFGGGETKGQARGGPRRAAVPHNTRVTTTT
jgi:hypothetical protein